MPTKAALEVAAALLAALLLSCDGAPTSAPPPTIPEEKLCSEVGNAGCDRVFTCPEGETIRAAVGGTKTGCLRYAANICAGCSATSHYHADKAWQCVQGIRELACAALQSLPSSGDPRQLIPACQEICQAPRGDGGP